MKPKFQSGQIHNVTPCTNLCNVPNFWETSLSIKELIPRYPSLINKELVGRTRLIWKKFRDPFVPAISTLGHKKPKVYIRFKYKKLLK